MRLEPHLSARPANCVALTPVDFLLRSVEVFPTRPAVAWRDRRWTYREFARMVGRLCRFLKERGVQAGDVVSVMAGNRPEMLAAHYAVPMIGAVLNTVNTRLDADAVGFILNHAESRMVLSDAASRDVASLAAKAKNVQCVVFADDGERHASLDVLDLLADDGIDIALENTAVVDEWQPISLNYTSGTTGDPKGVVCHHRGAYLNSIGNVLALGLNSRSAYLWTLPMFHCNGWCHTWAVTAAGALHVCLDKVDPGVVFAEIARHGVTHMSCAPVVLYMLLNHPAREGHDPARRVNVAMGGAAPTSTLINELDALGFDLTHLYGLTESFGPVTMQTLAEHQNSLDAAAKAVELSKQGVRHISASRVRVLDDAAKDVPADGVALGEIVLAGNTVMAGYYRDAEATAAAFLNDVFHTGDMAVRHSDGSIEIKDRSKDIIISGGENISSIEIENALHQHPAVLLAAVVAAPDPKWGETPYAFIEVRPNAGVNSEELKAYCRERLAPYKTPRHFSFGELPKTGTGKVQKFMLRARARELAAGAE
ncbi:AMP-binding protein [Aminobacter niigataensis]|uniref:AMP-binding protein n=1 Tax=Aminobacter niigataensis TaxID=83265 RepID=UPI0024C5C6FD|nr:AMP-binding protein [Aminobacter niigataensis]CAI2933116.1 Long-chain-fatty-acid--CoA ligase [Aminobacter niigataensis]